MFIHALIEYVILRLVLFHVKILYKDNYYYDINLHLKYAELIE